MDAITTIAPVQDWEAASRRVENYLRALGVEDPVRRNKLVCHLLERTRVGPSGNAVTMTMRTTLQEIDDWFQEVLEPRAAAAPGHVSARGRVALLLTGLPANRPSVFLSDGEVPVDVRQALNNIHLQPAPEWRPARMVPQPVEINPLATQAWEKLDGITVVQAGAIIVGILGVFWVLFQLTM